MFDWHRIIHALFMTKFGDTFVEGEEEMRGAPGILMSSVGQGKTSVIKAVARSYYRRVNGRKLAVPCVPWEPGAIGEAGTGVMPALRLVPEAEQDDRIHTYRGVKHQYEVEFPPPAELARVFADGVGIWIFDEITAGVTPQIQAALLTAIQQHRLGTWTAPPRVRILGACNPRGRNITEPSEANANRCIWLPYVHDRVADVIAFLERGAKRDRAREMTIDIDAEDAAVDAAWDVNFARSVQIVCGLLRTKPDLVETSYVSAMAALGTKKVAPVVQTPFVPGALMPAPAGAIEAAVDPGIDPIGAPVPFAFATERSWEMATRMLTTARIQGLSEDETWLLVAGCVGSGPTIELFNYARHADLLPAIEYLEGRAIFEPNMTRPDRTWSVAQGVYLHVKAISKDAPMLRRLLPLAYKFLTHISSISADVASSVTKKLDEADLKQACPEFSALLRVLNPAVRP